MSTASVKDVSEVVHELRREQVNGDGEGTNECEGNREKGFKCHRKPRVLIGG
jgi:hypothetical protein